MQNAKILIDALRNILFFIDNIVYSFIPMLYRMILYLANVDLFTDNIPVQGLIKRIYIIVGVFMLFKLSFSIMNYIVNPDDFSDQSKGFSNVVKRVMIAVVLLVSIPWFFGEAYMLQGGILKSGVLQKLILGETGETSDSLETTIETSAKDLQFLLFSPFFHLNYNSGGTEISDSSGDLSACKPTESAPSTHILGSSDLANSDCFETVANLMDNDDDVEASGVTLYSFFRFEDSNGVVQDYRKFDSFGGLVTWALSDGEYAIKYRAVFSTIFGGYLVFLLLSFCIDVAARVIRLLFLQILSPVAVISSIDPTTSGDRLKEWAKECLKVWASLFLRLAIIFIIIQLVRIITNSVYSGNLLSKNSGIKLSGNGDVISWLYLFLILGVFQAAKKIPELIEKATGIKMSGELQMNPIKALSENVALQKGLGVATGIGIGAVGAATGAGAGRILSGAYQGLKGKNALDVQKTMVEGNRTMRNARSDGSTFGGRLRARATNFFGNQGALGRVEDKKVKLENDKTRIENEIQPVRDAIQVESEILGAINEAKSRATTKAKQTNAVYIRRIAEADAMEQEGKQTNNAALIAQAQTMRNDAERDAATIYAQEWFNNNQDDADIQVAMGKYRRAIQTANRDGSAIQGTFSEQASASGIWNQENDLKINSNDLSLSIAAREDEIKAIDKQIEKNDMDHRRVESDYKAVGGQSGGTREKNATARSDAGQHFGTTNFFGPMGPPPGGGHGPGGPGYRP